MRAALGIVSLLLVMAVVGLLVKKQLAATRVAVPVLQTVPGETPAPPAATVRAQSQQVQQQVQQAVEGLMQQVRPMPDDDH